MRLKRLRDHQNEHIYDLDSESSSPNEVRSNRRRELHYQRQYHQRQHYRNIQYDYVDDDEEGDENNANNNDQDNHNSNDDNADDDDENNNSDNDDENPHDSTRKMPTTQRDHVAAKPQNSSLKQLLPDITPEIEQRFCALYLYPNLFTAYLYQRKQKQSPLLLTRNLHYDPSMRKYHRRPYRSLGKNICRRRYIDVDDYYRLQSLINGDPITKTKANLFDPLAENDISSNPLSPSKSTNVFRLSSICFRKSLQVQIKDPIIIQVSSPAPENLFVIVALARGNQIVETLTTFVRYQRMCFSDSLTPSLLENVSLDPYCAYNGASLSFTQIDFFSLSPPKGISHRFTSKRKQNDMTNDSKNCAESDSEYCLRISFHAVIKNLVKDQSSTDAGDNIATQTLLYHADLKLTNHRGKWLPNGTHEIPIVYPIRMANIGEISVTLCWSYEYNKSLSHSNTHIDSNSLTSKFYPSSNLHVDYFLFGDNITDFFVESFCSYRCPWCKSDYSSFAQLSCHLMTWHSMFTFRFAQLTSENWEVYVCTEFSTWDGKDFILEDAALRRRLRTPSLSYSAYADLASSHPVEYENILVQIVSHIPSATLSDSPYMSFISHNNLRIRHFLLSLHSSAYQIRPVFHSIMAQYQQLREQQDSEYNIQNPRPISYRTPIPGNSNAKYYRSITAAPTTLNSGFDSDEEFDDSWLQVMRARAIDELSNVPTKAKELMKSWNMFVNKNNVYADFVVPSACVAYVKQHAAQLKLYGLRNAFLSHLLSLWEWSLIDVGCIENCIKILSHG